MPREIYRPSRLLGHNQNTALSEAFWTLVYAAQDEARVSQRRGIAKDARRLVEAFGQRIDGKSCSPFGQSLPRRLRCWRCHHTAITRGPIVQINYRWKGAEDVGSGWFCCDCLHEQIRVAPSYYDSFEVVGASAPEVPCAA